MDAGAQRGGPLSVQSTYMLSGTGMCHSTGSLSWWSSRLYQGRGLNPNRASDNGCSPGSPRLQGILGASPWGWRGGHLSSAGVLLLRSCVTSGGVTEKWTVSAMSKRTREWSTEATRTGKKTCIAEQMVINIWSILNPPENFLFLIRSTLVAHLLSSFGKEYDLQASRPSCNVRTVKLLIYINVNKLYLSILFTSSIYFYFHSCNAGFRISSFSSLFKNYSH